MLLFFSPVEPGRRDWIHDFVIDTNKKLSTNMQDHLKILKLIFKKRNNNWSEEANINLLIQMYLPTPSHKQDVTQGQFWKLFNRFELIVLILLEWLTCQV